MEDEYLQGVWNSQDQEMEQFMARQDPSYEMTQLKKAKAKLRSLLIPKIIGIVLGLGWMSFMFLLLRLSLLHSPHTLGKIFFMGSVGLIFLSTSLAVGLYAKDLFTLHQIDHSGSVIQTQLKLAELNESILNSVRISWLQLPFYTTFYLNEGLLAHGGPIFWIIQILATGTTVWLALWLFRNIKSKNTNNTRIHNFLQGYGFYALLQAKEFLNEIDHFGQVAENDATEMMDKNQTTRWNRK